MNVNLPRLVISRLDRGYPATSCELILKMQQAIVFSQGEGPGQSFIFADLFIDSKDEETNLKLEARYDRPESGTDSCDPENKTLGEDSKIHFEVCKDSSDPPNVTTVKKIDGKSPDDNQPTNPVRTTVEGFDVIIDPNPGGKARITVKYPEKD